MAKYNITPVTKPRMTQSDKWKHRDCVDRYWAFKSEVRAQGVSLPNHSHITFIIPVAASWSKKKKAEYVGTQHTFTPDLDNLLKAIGDAVYDNDQHLSDLRATKIWGEAGAIIIEPMETIIELEDM